MTNELKSQSHALYTEAPFNCQLYYYMLCVLNFGSSFKLKLGKKNQPQNTATDRLINSSSSLIQTKVI